MPFLLRINEEIYNNCGTVQEQMLGMAKCLTGNSVAMLKYALYFIPGNE